MALAQLKGEPRRALLTKLRSYIAAGDAEDLIAHKIGISWGEYEELKTELLFEEEDKLRKRSTGQVYVEYCLAQEQNVRDLTTMIEKFETTKQYNAMVGAVRARAEILDKVVSRGQDFGFIEKRPEVRIVAGVPVNQLTDVQLRSHITAELRSIADLQQRYGDGVNILDIEPREVHSGPVNALVLTSPVSPERAKPHARARVHGGRRRVRDDEAPL